jgi:hypothetical protein
MEERSTHREGGEGRESRRERRSGPQGWRRAREARRAAAAGWETGRGTEPARKGSVLAGDNRSGAGGGGDNRARFV